MNARSVSELVDRMRERALIAADAPAPEADVADRPWFVTLLLGFAGWLAGIFLLVFVGLLLDLDRTASFLVAGLVLLAAAWGLYAADRKAVFLDQFALALSIAGQFAIAWAVTEGSKEPLVLAVTLLTLQLLVFFMMPNRVARTLGAFFAVVAWTYVIRLLLEPASGYDDLFVGHYGTSVPPPLGAWTLPVEWLLTWVPMLALAIWLIRREVVWMASGTRDFARPGLTGLLLGLAIGGFTTGLRVPELLLGADPASGIGFSWRAIFPLFSIGLAMCAAYGAFRLRSVGLLGFAILAALAHLSRFYFVYGTTLLWKSLIMLCVGVLLLGVGELLRRRHGGLPA